MWELVDSFIIVGLPGLIFVFFVLCYVCFLNTHPHPLPDVWAGTGRGNGEQPISLTLRWGRGEGGTLWWARCPPSRCSRGRCCPCCKRGAGRGWRGGRPWAPLLPPPGAPSDPRKKTVKAEAPGPGLRPKESSGRKVYLQPRSGRGLVRQRQDRAPRLPCPLLLQLEKGCFSFLPPPTAHPPAPPHNQGRQKQQSQKPTLNQVSPSLSPLRLGSSRSSRLDCLPTPPKTPPQSPSLRALSCPRGPE